MFIADVIPFMRIPRSAPQVFSYFTPRDLKKGSLVDVSVGKRVVKGVVLAARPVQGSKLEIRKSAFVIKSVKKIHTDIPAYHGKTLQLADWIARRFWVPLGSVLPLFQPIEHVLAVHTETQIPASNPPPIFIQDARRAPAYIQYIRTALEEKKQTLVLCPDTYALRAMYTEISAHIRNAPVFAYGGTRSKKKTKEVLSGLQDAAMPTVIVGTRSALFLQFSNLGLVIAEAAGNAGYDAWGRVPRYHAIEVAEKLAQLHGAQLIYGDSVPSIALWQKMSSGAMPQPTGYKPPTMRCDIIDMRRESHWSSRHPITLPLKDTLRRAMRSDTPHEPSPDTQARKQIIVLVNRKGVATAFVCRKCGHVPRCGKCEAAMVLHGAEAFSKTVAGILRCHHCGASQEPPKQCPICDSYRMWPVGSGTVQVERDIKRIVPEARVLRIDSDSVKHERELERHLHEFGGHKADILVGTQLMLKEAILPQAALTVVLAAEQFFVFPEYNAAERAWRMFEVLRQKTTEHMIIQTLDADMPMLAHFVRGAHAEFLDAELQQRELFGYPPFGEIAKLTFAHTYRPRALHEARKLADILSGSHNQKAISYKLLGPSPAFIPKERGKWKFVLLLKFPQETTLETRNKALSPVPPGWQVEVNPRELL